MKPTPDRDVKSAADLTLGGMCFDGVAFPIGGSALAPHVALSFMSDVAKVSTCQYADMIRAWVSCSIYGLNGSQAISSAAPASGVGLCSRGDDSAKFFNLPPD
jgi:hypothetical protein